MRYLLLLLTNALMGCETESESKSLPEPIHYYDLEAKVIKIYPCEKQVCMAQVKLDEKGLVKELWRFEEEIKVGDLAFRKCWFTKALSDSEVPKSEIQKNKLKVETSLGNNNCKYLAYIKA